MDSPDILNAPLPDPFDDENTINLFQKLILVKALREDKLQSAIASFVGKKVGPKFAESPNASMEDIYRDLDNKVIYFNFLLLLFILLMLIYLDTMYFCIINWC